MGPSEIDPSEIAALLGDLERRLRGTAPADVVAHLRSIATEVAALAARFQSAASPRLAVVVATAAFLDAPQAVNAYLALAPAVRAAAPLAEERAPTALLRERLERLDTSLAAALDTAYAPALTRLVANGRFLRTRLS